MTRYTIEQLEEFSPKELGRLLWNMLDSYDVDVEYIKDIIAAGAELGGAMDTPGWTVLHRAARYGHVEVIKAMLEAGADLEIRDYNTMTPLHWMTNYGWIEMVKFLIELGASLEALDYFGFTPLHWAADRIRIDVAKLLINAGASLEALDNNGRTPWDVAYPKIKETVPELNPNYNG